LLSPAEEVAWLDRFYRERQHATFAVAVWAGAKAPQEPVAEASIKILNTSGAPVQGTLVVGDGHNGMRAMQPAMVTLHYQRYLPAPSPVPDTYRVTTRRNELVLVDGHGMIRDYQALGTRAQEAKLIQRLTTLRAESSSSGLSATP
jgi:hypothetical protein